MTPPKTIYLQVCGTCQDNECDKCDFDQLQEVTWCKDRIHDNDVAYFSEDAVRETLARYLANPQSIQAEINRLKGGEQ